VALTRAEETPLLIVLATNGEQQLGLLSQQNSLVDRCLTPFYLCTPLPCRHGHGTGAGCVVSSRRKHSAGTER
jgi:hypothetical protein